MQINARNRYHRLVHEWIQNHLHSHPVMKTEFPAHQKVYIPGTGINISSPSLVPSQRWTLNIAEITHDLEET